MQLESALDRLHRRALAIGWLQPFTVGTRLLLALGFLPSGYKKIGGERFTQLPLSDPVGFFFEAFYRTGVWYRFVGVAQIVAALLILVPRTAALGAVLYLTIIANVFLITVGVGFTGTPVITGLMLLASVYLVCWDYPRWKSLLFAPATVPEPPVRVSARRTVEWLTVAGGLGLTACASVGMLLSERMRGTPGRTMPALTALGLGIVAAGVASRRRGQRRHAHQMSEE